MSDLPYSKSQALRVIEALDSILKGSIQDHVLTMEMVEPPQPARLQTFCSVRYRPIVLKKSNGINFGGSPTSNGFEIV